MKSKFALAALVLVLPTRLCLAANATNPYGNIDHSNDAGNDTGDSQVDRLNQAQLDTNGITRYRQRAGYGNAMRPGYAVPAYGYAPPPPSYGYAPPPAYPSAYGYAPGYALPPAGYSPPPGFGQPAYNQPSYAQPSYPPPPGY